MDFQAWRNGMYIINAIQTAIDPKKVKYPKSPISEEVEKNSVDSPDIAAIRFNDFVEIMNKDFKKKD